MQRWVLGVVAVLALASVSSVASADDAEVTFEHVTSGGYPMDVLWMHRKALVQCMKPTSGVGELRVDIGADGHVTSVTIKMASADVGCIRSHVMPILFPEKAAAYFIAGQLVYHPAS